MSSKISSCRHELQQNLATTSVEPRAWRGRSRNGRGFTILPNAHVDRNDKGLSRVVRWSFATLRSHAHNETGLLAMSHQEFAERIGGSVSTAKRHIGRLEETYYIRVMPQVDPRTGGWTRNLIKVYTPAERDEILKSVENKSKIDPTPQFINEPSVLINTSSSQDFKNPPTPQGGNGVCESLLPVRPQPSREVHEALQQARAARAVRKAQQRQERYARNRKVRGCAAELTGFQRAALEVMSLCGVAATSWRVRDGIAAAISLHVEGCEERAKRAVESMVIAWRDYLDDHQLLRCPLGMESFFVSGAWKDRRQWRYDPDELRRWRNRY